MIIVYHKENKVIEVCDKNLNLLKFNKNLTIAKIIVEIAKTNPTSKIVWCNINIKNNVNFKFIESSYLSNNFIVSYSIDNFFSDDIGYIENSPFIKINKSVTYASWQMSSMIGFANASVFLKAEENNISDKNFNFYINCISKSFMLLGLFCISEPQLLLFKNSDYVTEKATKQQLFKFVRMHNRLRWIFILLINIIIYDKKFPLFAFMNSLFYKQFRSKKVDFEISDSQIIDLKTDTIDVLIPTIGRKKQLLDVLMDLKNQTHLPNRILIIEQNPLENSVSELDYLQTKSWPFEIEHTFTHQSGACNARNIGLNQAKNEWIFFADDDVRFEKDFIENCIKKLKINNYHAVTVASLQKNEVNIYKNSFQWHTFGTCSSFVKTSVLERIRFGMEFEFGYGEDDDFGMRIRNSGTDIAFFHEPKLLHLKAPIGGFRTKFVNEWDNENTQPKPSPTIMLLKMTHSTQQEIKGYKTLLFLKFYKVNTIKNPLKYLKQFNKRWQASIYWANFLKNKNN